MNLEPIDAEFLALSVRAAEHGLAKVASELGLEKQALDVPTVTSSTGGVRPEAQTGATYGGIGGAALGAIASALIHRAIAKRKGTKSNLLVDGALGGLAGGALGMGAGYLAGNKGHFFTPQSDLGVDVKDGNTTTPVPLTVVDELAKAEANKSIWNQKGSLLSQGADLVQGGSNSVLPYVSAPAGAVGGGWLGNWLAKNHITKRGPGSNSLMTASNPDINKAIGAGVKSHSEWWNKQQTIPQLEQDQSAAETKFRELELAKKRLLPAAVIAKKDIHKTRLAVREGVEPSPPSTDPKEVSLNDRNRDQEIARRGKSYATSLENGQKPVDEYSKSKQNAQAARSEIAQSKNKIDQLKGEPLSLGTDVPQRFATEIRKRSAKGMNPAQMEAEIRALQSKGQLQGRMFGHAGKAVGGAAGAGLGYALPQVIARLIGGGRTSDAPTMSDPQN